MSANWTGAKASGLRRAAAAVIAALVIGCSQNAAATIPLGSAPVTSGAPAATETSAPGDSPTSAAPAPSQPPPTPLEQALAGVNADGTFSKDTALAAFVAAFGSLPDVTVPTSAGPVESGTLAIDMVSAHWDELTDPQRASIQDWVGHDQALVLPAAFHANAASPEEAAADQASTDIAAHVGHGLRIPIVIVPPDSGTLKDSPDALAWTIVRYDAKGKTPEQCEISVTPDATVSPATLRFVMLHEVWHCYEGELVNRATRRAVPLWLSEGEAQWVAETITNGAGAPSDVGTWWNDYLAFPDTPLPKRTYDAVGFFSQLNYEGGNAWKLLEPMYASGDSDSALAIAHYSDPAFRDAWGSSFYRDGQPSSSWAMTSGDGIPTAYDSSATPKGVQLKDDAVAGVKAPALTAMIADIHTRAFVTEVTAIGSVRIGDPGGGGIDDAIDDTTVDLCTTSGGDCTCPPNTFPRGPTKKAPPNFRLAVTGDQKADAAAALEGISKDKWCAPALNLTVDGTLGGKPISGQVLGDPATALTCYANSPGSPHAGNIVHWNGYTKDTNTPIAGEFDVEYGTWSLGDAVGDQSITIDEIAPVYQHLSSVSGTITQNPGGGSIDAVAADGADTVHVTGTWTCPSGATPAPSP